MTSASTLARRAREADKKGHRSAAKRLREQAAAMRRAARRKKKPKKARRARKAKRVTAKLRPFPFILPDAKQERSPLDQACDNILGLEADEGQRIKLRAALVEARVTATSMADDRWRGQMDTIKTAHNIAIVSGFMAIVESMDQFNNGTLPHTVTLTGHTVAKVYDALRKAGYTRDGMSGGGAARERLKNWQVNKKWNVVTDADADEAAND